MAQGDAFPPTAPPCTLLVQIQAPKLGEQGKLSGRLRGHPVGNQPEQVIVVMGADRHIRRVVDRKGFTASLPTAHL